MPTATDKATTLMQQELRREREIKADLLAACRQVSEFLSSHCGCDECWKQMHAIRAAIAKAESTP